MKVGFGLEISTKFKFQFKRDIFNNQTYVICHVYNLAINIHIYVIKSKIHI